MQENESRFFTEITELFSKNFTFFASRNRNETAILFNDRGEKRDRVVVSWGIFFL